MADAVNVLHEAWNGWLFVPCPNIGGNRVANCRSVCTKP